MHASKWFNALNCFQYCSKVLQVLGSVMVLVVIGIVGFTYWAVVPATYGPMAMAGHSAVTKALAAVACIYFTIVVSLGKASGGKIWRQR